MGREPSSSSSRRRSGSGSGSSSSSTVTTFKYVEGGPPDREAPEVV